MKPENVVCPECGEPMVSRANKTTGQRFFGCSNFPTCKGTRDTDGESKYDHEPQKANRRYEGFGRCAFVAFVFLVVWLAFWLGERDAVGFLDSTKQEAPDEDISAAPAEDSILQTHDQHSNHEQIVDLAGDELTTTVQYESLQWHWKLCADRYPNLDRRTGATGLPEPPYCGDLGIYGQPDSYLVCVDGIEYSTGDLVVTTPQGCATLGELRAWITEAWRGEQAAQP